MSAFTKTACSVSKPFSHLKRLLKDNSGGTGLMMGLTAIPVALAFGMAFDTAMITREQSAFYQSVDNAALAVAANERSMFPENAAASVIAEREAEMETYAEKYLHANYSNVLTPKENGPDTGEEFIRVDIKLTGQSVNLKAEIDVPTPFMSVLNPVKGYNRDMVTLKSDSVVQRAMRPIEIAFVLDTTGSMANDIDTLQTAANKMLSTLYSDPSPEQPNMTSPFIRVSLVPFSAAVRLNPLGHDFNMDWIDTTGANPLSRINFKSGSGWHNFMAWGRLRSNATTPNRPMEWNGCVESRIALAPDGANYITSDIEPDLDNPHSLFPAYFNPDSPTWFTDNRSSYINTSGSTRSADWNNQYISSRRNYADNADSSLLAPGGSNKTGFDDSVIGNKSLNFEDRFKNVAKYDGKVLTPERFTANGNGWIQSAGPWNNCTASAVVPLTHQRARIVEGIAAMRASGNTNIAEGLAWGMRTVSPGAPFTQVEGAPGIPSEPISAYGSPKWQKIVLLMSDGENVAGQNQTDTGTNYNSFGFSATPNSGSPSLNRYRTTSQGNVPTTMNNYTSAMCTQMKASNITIYAVGFRLDNPILRNCATSPAHYKFANSEAELVTYFDGIGRDVLNKMVYVSK